MKIQITRHYAVTTEHEVATAHKDEHGLPCELALASEKATFYIHEALRKVEGVKVVQAGVLGETLKIEVKL